MGGKGAYLNDLLILHTSEEDVLLVLVGMEGNDVRSLSVREGFDALPCSNPKATKVSTPTRLKDTKR